MWLRSLLDADYIHYKNKYLFDDATGEPLVKISICKVVDPKLPHVTLSTTYGCSPMRYGCSLYETRLQPLHLSIFKVVDHKKPKPKPKPKGKGKAAAAAAAAAADGPLESLKAPELRAP